MHNMAGRNLIDVTHKLSRFASKSAEEAENPCSEQSISNIQATGDYSSEQGVFYIKPPLGMIYEIHRISILIRDNIAITSDEYVSSGPLTNGISYKIGNGCDILVNTVPIKCISDYASYSGIDVKTLDLVQSRSWAINWSLSASGSPLYLQSKREESIRIFFNDDFSSLNHHTALFQGIIWDCN
jgi:hypothetical protein